MSLKQREIFITHLYREVCTTRHQVAIAKFNIDRVGQDRERLRSQSQLLTQRLQHLKRLGREAVFELMLHTSHRRFMRFVTELEKTPIRRLFFNCLY